MDHLDYSHHDALLDFAGTFVDPNEQRAVSYPSHPHPHQHHQHHQPRQQHQQHQHQQTWPPLDLDTMENNGMPQYPLHQQQRPQSQHHQSQSYLDPQALPRQQQRQEYSRPGSSQTTQPINLQTSGLDLDYANMLPSSWHDTLQHYTQQQQQFNTAALNMDPYNAAAFSGQLQASPVDFMPVTSAANMANLAYAAPAGLDTTTYMTLAGPMESMNALVYPLNDYANDPSFALALSNAALAQHAAESVHSHGSIPGGSPTGTILEVQSVSDNEWSLVNYNPNRNSYDSFTGTVSNPSQNLHIRTNSDSSTSDGPNSADLSGSYEEIPPWPLSSPHDFHGSDYLDAQYIQHAHGLPMTQPHQHRHHTTPSSSLAVSPTNNAMAYRCGSSSTSPTSSGPLSPPLRRRRSPTDTTKTTKPVIKKTSTALTHGPARPTTTTTTGDKKVGRRKGPLRPDQRQQAHEIRKLRACLRCKFLKKTCDKGEPCGGCRPSHARLWQVPCTRMDIKDIAYFMKDWKADYERHVSLGFSVHNIKGFGAHERTVYVTHGFGHYLPISAREVFVRDDECFGVDWVEGLAGMQQFETSSAKLSAGSEGVSETLLSEYLDRHLDQGFEAFVDNLFEGTVFVTEILKTAYRYYAKARTPSIRKALKLVLAYNLTQHVTMIEGLSEHEQAEGVIADPASKFAGKTVAPVMLNFQIKTALASLWRSLQADILAELSTLYSSVYSGEKLKHWPTIFILAALLLVVWEEMQFDCHYRVQDAEKVKAFCEEMERTPVGVVVGLFQAISTKLPGLGEWDTRKHGQVLGGEQGVCGALEEVREGVVRHGEYISYSLWSGWG